MKNPLTPKALRAADANAEHWTRGCQAAPPRKSRLSLSERVAGYAIALLSLTAVHGIRYYNEPQLTVGSRSPQTFLAPAAAEIEDVEATQARQAEARRAGGAGP
jgi:membrane-associated HD superfamily phosphohydrolase